MYYSLVGAIPFAPGTKSAKSNTCGLMAGSGLRSIGLVTLGDDELPSESVGELRAARTGSGMS